MSVTAPWLFPEFSPVGVELGSAEAVASYDHKQGTDPARTVPSSTVWGRTPECALSTLPAAPGRSLSEAAKRGVDAHGVDVSERMLDFTRRRAEEAGVEVSLHHAGFLTYEHAGRAADVVTTKSALHQLPDFWKQAALLRIAEYLRPGGLLYIWDMIFTLLLDPRRPPRLGGLRCHRHRVPPPDPRRDLLPPALRHARRIWRIYR
jgi:putative AdoMet-dependent methyltransferase